MAEMYGDVMDLNERLHKDIAAKDKTIESLRTRLRRAGLEVGVSLLHHYDITTADLEVCLYYITVATP